MRTSTLAIYLFAGTLAVSAQPAAITTPSPQEVVAEMNRERAAEGLRPLALNET